MRFQKPTAGTLAYFGCWIGVGLYVIAYIIPILSLVVDEKSFFGSIIHFLLQFVVSGINGGAGLATSFLPTYLQRHAQLGSRPRAGNEDWEVWGGNTLRNMLAGGIGGFAVSAVVQLAVSLLFIGVLHFSAEMVYIFSALIASPLSLGIFGFQQWNQYRGMVHNMSRIPLAQ